MNSILHFILKHRLQSNRLKPVTANSGMTMIELLVGTIMAFLIITPILGFAVNILNDDRREGVKAATEEELQSAVDYIAEDVSQALYIYHDNPSDPDGSEIDRIVNQLPAGNPVLVFWKRKILEDAVPINSGTAPKDCTPLTCDDTYVLSLVAYYLKEDNNAIWCQPQGNTCPKRIVRYEISDGLRDANGNPLPDAQTDPDQRPDEAYNSDFTLSEPTEKVTTGSDFPTEQVLVNYIDDFQSANLVSATTNDILSNAAQITITANSLRRIESNPPGCTQNTPYCPSTTVTLRGLSGIGAAN